MIQQNPTEFCGHSVFCFSGADNGNTFRLKNTVKIINSHILSTYQHSGGF
jgi:hypothetical protein